MIRSVENAGIDFLLKLDPRWKKGKKTHQLLGSILAQYLTMITYIFNQSQIGLFRTSYGYSAIWYIFMFLYQLACSPYVISQQGCCILNNQQMAVLPNELLNGSSCDLAFGKAKRQITRQKGKLSWELDIFLEMLTKGIHRKPPNRQDRHLQGGCKKERRKLRT